MPTPRIERERCQGHGICAAVAPNIFDLDGDGKVIALVNSVKGEERADLDEAVAMCPEKAISVSNGWPERLIGFHSTI